MTFFLSFLIFFYLIFFYCTHTHTPIILLTIVVNCGWFNTSSLFCVLFYIYDHSATFFYLLPQKVCVRIIIFLYCQNSRLLVFFSVPFAFFYDATSSASVSFFCHPLFFVFLTVATTYYLLFRISSQHRCSNTPLLYMLPTVAAAAAGVSI